MHVPVIQYVINEVNDMKFMRKFNIRRIHRPTINGKENRGFNRMKERERGGREREKGRKRGERERR